MVRFRGHVVAALLLLSASVNAVPRPRTGGEGNDALAFIQHSLKSSSQAQLQTASLEAAPPKKAMTPEEKQKERQRKMKKIEREAKAKGCPPGHSLVAGDVPGGDQFGRDNKHKTDTVELCMEDCASKPLCVSFEWSPNSHVCNSNKEVPAKYGKPWQDFMLCVRNATQGPAAGSEPPLAMAAANESSAAAANETAAAANGAKAAEEAPAKQPAEAEAPAKQAAEPEAPVKQPAEAEAPAKQAAEPEAPWKQPAEVEAPAKQAAEPEAPAKQPAEAEAPAKQAVQPEAPAKQPAEAEAPAKQAPEPEAPAKQAAESEAPAKQAAEAEAPAKQAAESEAPAKQAAEAEAPAKQAAESEAPAKQAAESEARAKDIAAVEEHTEVNRKSEEESERKSEEGARKAKEEADHVVEEEAERKAKELAEHKAQDEAMKAKEEADRLAKEEAERKAKEEAERKAKEEADRLAQEEAARKDKEEAERLEREEAERKAKEEAERLERQEAERKAEEEARKAKEEADRLEAERKAKEEAERLQREEAERKAKEEAERQEAERKVEEEARKAKEEADRLAQEEAEREAKEEAERKAKEEAERKAKEEAERKAKEEAERLEREEAERKAKEEAERLEAERKAKEEAERKAKEEAARLEAERKAKEAACAGGYVYVQGDVPGWDQFGHENVKKATARLCRKSCDAVEDCLSYEWSPTTKICSLNKDRQPTVDSFEDYIFCQRSEEYYQKWQEKQARLAKEKTEAADLARKESDEERRGLQELAESQARARLEREERKRAEEERKVAEAEAAEEAKRKEEEEARKREEFAVGMINIEDAAAEDEAEEKRKEEEARRQAEELARQQAEEAAAAERRAREAKEAEQEAERKAEEEARQLHEEEKQRQTDEEARLKAEEQAKELEIVEAVQRAQEQEEETKAEEAESEKASEEAKQKAEEDAKRIAEEQKKAEEEERLLELEKTDPAAAALQRRKAMFKAKMAAALERKRLMAEKKRKKEEAVSDRLQAMDLEIKRKQREEEERRRREEEETRRKQEEEEAKRKAEEDAKAQEAAQLILKEQEERDRQTRAEDRATEQKVSAASRSFLAASPTSDPARKNSVTLRVQDTHGKSMVLKVSRTTRLKVMMNTACSRLGLLLADAQFTHGGRPVSPTDTTESFGLSDNDLIKVDDFIKVDDLVEAEETKDEDPAAKAEKAQVVVRNKEDAAKWQASAKAALQGLPAPRSAQDARNKAEKVVPLLKDTEIDGILFGSSSNPAGAYWGNSLNISRYDIPALRVQDSTFRFPKIIKSVQKTVTCWPSGLALASTWDEQLVGRVAGATAAEMRGKGANLMFAPSVAVVRVAASGRNFEQLSGEDPYLGARLAKSFVRATQKEGVMAAVRGFGFVHQETNRRVMDVKVDDKVAFELYYPPFEAAIQAGVAGVTCSPTKVNGTGGCEHPKLLKGDLKGALQFPGFVVSEEPPYSGPSSIDRGLDVTMPSPQERKAWMPWGEASPQAKTEAATRLLTSIYRSRMDELPEWQASMALSAQSSEQRTQQNTDLAVQAATSAVTLLKNNGVLPLSPSSVKRIAVLGNAASARPQISFINADYYSGGGPAHVPAANGAEATPLEQIKRRAKAAQVAVETGPFNATPGQAKDVASMAGVDVVVVVAATTSAEGGDRTSLALDDSVDALIAAVAPVKPTVVLMQTPGAVLTPWRDDVAAAANLFLAGEATGKAWAAILFGDASPGGKLPLAMPRTEADVVRPTSSMKVHYSEGLHTSYRSNTFAAAFPFGHGLSYTDFTYGAPQVLAKGCLAKACVRLDVTNTGERPGSEVVQAYVQFGAAENMPRVLRSFHKTAVLKPGHAEEVFLMFTPRDLSTYHPETGWVEQTNVKVEIGSSSADVRQTIWVNVNVAVDVEPETF